MTVAVWVVVYVVSLAAVLMFFAGSKERSRRRDELSRLLDDIHGERGIEITDPEMRDRVLDALAQVAPDRIAHWDEMSNEAGGR